MPIECQQSTSGGKGNKGMFIERDPYMCAAGIPSQQAEEDVAKSLQHYLLQDQVDALISDAIIPTPKQELKPYTKEIDRRNAGVYTDVREIISPPMKTKFETLVEDIKETTYASYWDKPLGKGPNPTPMLPPGFDRTYTTYGKVWPSEGRLYDIIMPKEPLPDKTPYSKWPGVQTDRQYCKPPFSKDLTYGRRSMTDKRGVLMKCSLTYNNVVDGTSNRAIVNDVQVDFLNRTTSAMGTVLSPNSNITAVPEGYAFGMLKPPDNLPECLTFCEINPEKDHLRKCLSHLNSLKKVLSKRFLPSFFRDMYLAYKYFDKNKCGWLPKQVVYDYCNFKLIRFDPQLLEPLFTLWGIFKEQQIEYKTFSYILNFKEPLPDLPKIQDVPPKCLNFKTTYREMVKPGQEIDTSRMAGVPSGRYLDRDYPITPDLMCKADRENLPQETEVKACLNPSLMTAMGIDHRDMYAKREPHVVRRVFTAYGKNFTDEEFDAYWKEAQALHSQGWVCYQTFRDVVKKHEALVKKPSPLDIF